jgi:hypothetical protein
MNRLVWLIVCALLGLVALVCGLLVPAHLRAVDAGVLAQAGRNTPGLVEQGLALVERQQLGAAELLFDAAEAQRLPGREALAGATAKLAVHHPPLRLWGSPAPALEALASDRTAPEPVTDFLVRLENRQRVLELLGASKLPAVQELLRFRTLTNTVLFPPSLSSSGQALDAALSLCGLLVDQGRVTASLSNSVFVLAASANRGGNTQPLEEVLMSLMSLGQRLNWGQLAAWVGQMDQPETLRLQASLARRDEARLGVLFSAVELSGQPRAVANYLMNFGQSGMDDLGASLRYGAGGVQELLQRNQRLHQASSQLSSASESGPLAALAWHQPGLALALKWFLYVLSGFFLATAMHFAWPVASSLERPLQVRGFHVAREGLFALGFLLVVLLLSEPFLTQESQKVDFPFRLHLPTLGSAAPAGITSVHAPIMNKLSLLTLLLFFVLQGLLYVACLVKLAEIRRQRVPSRIKLRLLENEEHLFDAGLYLGFVGTIISFILVAIGWAKFSIMAAYSSTSFGIIYVCIFKIFNLRPARRKLLLEAEAGADEPAVTAKAPRPALVTTP